MTLPTILSWREVLDIDFPEMRVTEESREAHIRYAKRVGTRGDVRMAMGLFYTDEEYQSFRDEVLARPLP
jgi:hypothetical protein